MAEQRAHRAYAERAFFRGQVSRVIGADTMLMADAAAICHYGFAHRGL